MKPATNITGLLAVFAAFVSSAPINGNVTILVERSGGRDCGGVQYSLQEASDAYDEGIHRLRNGQFVYNGATAFPEEFRNGLATNPEVDPSPCKGLQLYEWPILASGGTYNSGSPGPDRVVFADSNSNPGSYEQCFLMTHTGASGNLFLKCT